MTSRISAPRYPQDPDPHEDFRPDPDPDPQKKNADPGFTYTNRYHHIPNLRIHSAYKAEPSIGLHSFIYALTLPP